MPSISFAILANLALLVLMVLPAQADNRIERVTIASESTNQVVLDVVYSYDGDQGANVALSAVMADDGEASSHYAYRPGRIEPGRHRARVTLGTNAGAPESFSTSQLVIAMYVGGGSAFLKQPFSFAKTWSKPGAQLRPVLRLAELSPRLALQRRPQLELQQIETPDPAPGSASAPAGGVSRHIRPDGTVELRYPDGTIRHLFGGGETVTRPDGSSSTMLYQNAQPPSPPTAPPDAGHASWLAAENERLLGIMRSLVDDEQSIQNYLEREGEDRTPYQRIDARTEAVGWLVRP